MISSEEESGKQRLDSCQSRFIRRSQNNDFWNSPVPPREPHFPSRAALAVSLLSGSGETKGRSGHEQRRPFHRGSQATARRFAVPGDRLCVQQYWAGLESSAIGPKYCYLPNCVKQRTEIRRED